MRVRASLSLPLVSVVAAAGCLGFAPVRVAEIESTTGDTTTVREVTYGDDGRVEEIETTTEGNFVGRLELIWEGGVISALVYERQGQEELDVTLTYEGGRLVAMEAEQGDTDYRIELGYWNDDPGYLERHELVVEDGNGTTTTERTIEYEDGVAVSGREETTFASGGGSLTFTDEVELTWGEDGLPEEAELTSKAFGATSTRDAEYVYDDNRRIEEVEYDDGDRVQVEYDDQGRMSEVEMTDGNNRTVTDISYEDGTQSGFVFVAPALPANELFDLTGKAFNRPELFSDAFFPVP